MCCVIQVNSSCIVNHIFLSIGVTTWPPRTGIFISSQTNRDKTRIYHMILQITIFSLYNLYVLNFFNLQTCPLLVEHSVRFSVDLVEHISSMTSDSQVWPVFTYAELYRTANNGSGKYCLILVVETLSTMIMIYRRRVIIIGTVLFLLVSRQCIIRGKLRRLYQNNTSFREVLVIHKHLSSYFLTFQHEIIKRL